MNNTVLCFHSLQTMDLPLAFLSHLPSLLLFLKKTKKKPAGTNHKKVYRMKTIACSSIGMEPSKTSQTRWECHHNTFTPSLHLVQFCQLCTTKTHSLNEHGTQHCSLHSLPHKRQSISATSSSNKISQCNLNSQHTMQTHHCSQFLHRRQTIPAMHSSNYIASTHNITHSPCALHTQQYPPTAFHNPPMHTTNKHKT